MAGFRGHQSALGRSRPKRKRSPNGGLACNGLHGVRLHAVRGRRRRALEDARRVTNINPNTQVPAYALAAIPARIAIERGLWKDAVSLNRAQVNFRTADAMTHFARALGAARSGDAATAEEHAGTGADRRWLKTAKTITGRRKSKCTPGCRRVVGYAKGIVTKR